MYIVMKLFEDCSSRRKPGGNCGWLRSRVKCGVDGPRVWPVPRFLVTGEEAENHQIIKYIDNILRCEAVQSEMT
jgi:hypothetical protein